MSKTLAGMASGCSNQINMELKTEETKPSVGTGTAQEYHIAGGKLLIIQSTGRLIPTLNTPPPPSVYHQNHIRPPFNQPPLPPYN